MLKIETSEGAFTARRYGTGDSVLLVSDRRETLEAVLETIELAGLSEDSGETLDALKIAGGSGHYDLVLSRATLALWASFEILNYLGGGEE